MEKNIHSPAVSDWLPSWWPGFGLEGDTLPESTRKAPRQPRTDEGSPKWDVGDGEPVRLRFGRTRLSSQSPNDYSVLMIVRHGYSAAVGALLSGAEQLVQCSGCASLFE